MDRQMKKYVILTILSLPLSVFANTIPVIEIDSAEQNIEIHSIGAPVNDFFKRLRPYEGTRVYADYWRGHEMDGHLDVQYSFRYLFTNPKRLLQGESDYEVSFTFSGEFDFFASTRDSGPVIGRRYNPGVMYQKVYAESEGWVAFSFGIEHESNGQTIDTPKTLYSQMQANKNRYSNRYPNLENSYYLEMSTDGISRSTEVFGAIGAVYRMNLRDTRWDLCKMDIRCFELYFKFRDSWGDVEDDVFWAPEQEANLLEHQGTQLAIYTGFEGEQSLSLVYRTGQLNGGKPGEKNTWDLSYTNNIQFSNDWSLPLIVSYHYGYLEELSLYSEKSSYFSIGLYFHL